MNVWRNLTVVGVATAVCAFGVMAGEEHFAAPRVDSSPINATDAPPSQSREILDEHPELIRWLLQERSNKDNTVAELAGRAISRLAPVATAELIKELDNRNTDIRLAAIGYMASVPKSHQKTVLAKLLAIAKDEKEDESVRQFATFSVCQILCSLDP